MRPERIFQRPAPVERPDAAAPRFLRIGKASVGLLGLDIALNAAFRQQLPEQEAADLVFARIKEQNYIPPGCEEQYREALLAAYRKHCGLSEGDEEGLVIRIFGKDCVSCNGLQSMLIDLLDRLGLAADVELIHDPDEIGRVGLTQTPALMVNGRVKSAGIVPSPAQVEQWLLLETSGRMKEKHG